MLLIFYNVSCFSYQSNYAVQIPFALFICHPFATRSLLVTCSLTALNNVSSRSFGIRLVSCLEDRLVHQMKVLCHCFAQVSKAQNGGRSCLNEEQRGASNTYSTSILPCHCLPIPNTQKVPTSLSIMKSSENPNPNNVAIRFMNGEALR
jgi:hypothetical protein